MRTSLFAIFALPLLWVSSAQAVLIYGITDPTPSLVSFDSATPGTLNTVGAISGIVAGQTLRGIDFRPSDGQLYALSSDASTAAQLYTIDLLTAVATPLGAGLILTGNTSSQISLDFNPVADALRVVTGTGQNYRVNANTGGLINQDTSLDPSNHPIAAIAYTNNFVGATQTTLYAYDVFFNEVYTIGSVNGSPVSPNTGTLFLVGASGFFAFTSSMGFDIDGATGVAYLSLDDSNSPDDKSEFFKMNLATGALTAAGGFNATLLDISVAPVAATVPEPASLALLLTGVAALAATFTRRTTRRPQPHA
jgi:Domain of unknown function (DUF4394)